MYKMMEYPGNGSARFLYNLFGRPWLAMIAWGAFVHMSAHHMPIDLPYFSYWEFFMLNLVCAIFTSSRAEKFIIEKEL